jgi:hypothetical protein
MKIADIAQKININLVQRGSMDLTEVLQVYAGDRVSDLLNHASTTTLIVTNILSNQLLRLAELMDVPALCLLNGAIPDGILLQAAKRSGTWLLSSPLGMFETCGRLYVLLAKERSLS